MEVKAGNADVETNMTLDEMLEYKKKVEKKYNIQDQSILLRLSPLLVLALLAVLCHNGAVAYWLFVVQPLNFTVAAPPNFEDYFIIEDYTRATYKDRVWMMTIIPVLTILIPAIMMLIRYLIRHKWISSFVHLLLSDHHVCWIWMFITAPAVLLQIQTKVLRDSAVIRILLLNGFDERQLFDLRLMDLYATQAAVVTMIIFYSILIFLVHYHDYIKFHVGVVTVEQFNEDFKPLRRLYLPSLERADGRWVLPVKSE